MAGHVHRGIALVDHGCTQAHETVDHAGHRVFIPRDERTCQDDGVALGQVDLVGAVGHTRQCRHGLALRTGAHEHNLVFGEVFDLFDVDDRTRWSLKVAQFLGDLHVPDHGPADKRHLASVGDSGF